MTKAEVEKMCNDFISNLPRGLQGYIILTEKANIVTKNVYEAANMSQADLLYLLHMAQGIVLSRINNEKERVSYELTTKTGTSNELPKL